MTVDEETEGWGPPPPPPPEEEEASAIGDGEGLGRSVTIFCRVGIFLGVPLLFVFSLFSSVSISISENVSLEFACLISPAIFFLITNQSPAISR